MKKIFISHSSQDKKLVLEFVDFLQTGMGVYRKQIFCTAMKGIPVAGSEFLGEIKREIAEDMVFIPIITENYLKSKICLMELGAAWVLNGTVGKLLYPLLAGKLGYGDLQDIPYRDIQMYRLDDGENMGLLYDALFDGGVIDDRNTAVFTTKLPKFLETLGGEPQEAPQEALREDPEYIEKNEDGYYIAQIDQERRVPADYRCYRVRGLVRDVLDGAEGNGETHWLFYYAGVYPDLHVGDTVAFKVHRTELRDFPDLKKARNIYPNALEVVKA